MKKAMYLLLLGAAVSFYVSCEKSAPEMPEEEPPGEECEPEFPDQNVTYENYVKSIVETHCTPGCHNGGNQGPGNFTTYTGLLSYAQRASFMSRVISDNADMPMGNAPLPEATRDSLNTWIANCAPED